MQEAQVSRRTFYSYFASKFEVVVALHAEAMDGMWDLLRALVERERDRSVDAARHRVVIAATHEHWHAVPELRDQWLSVVERFTTAIAGQLHRDLSQTPDHRQRAAGVLWATSTCSTSPTPLSTTTSQTHSRSAPSTADRTTRQRPALGAKR
jgi:AcrR family transcriptional regulator